MEFNLDSILTQLGKEKGIDRQLLIEAIESAMLSAARKHYGHNLNLETQYNEETGGIEVIQFKTVVEEVEEEGTQISVEDARKEYDSEAMVGDELGKKLDTQVLGRIAAQTAKQVIVQKVRDAERGVIFEEYKGRKGELINGIVQRYDRGVVVVNLGRTEAAMPKREQIGRERYRQGDRIRAMILDIDPTARGSQVILTRSHPDVLKKLFALEVPEIAEGVIEIKAVAREPGERAKIAVSSNDSSVDPVGACVGVKGSRVQAVVQELRGERIDIITWTPDEPSFVARSLSPAEVTRVVVDEDEHSMEVIVADDQLSLAIGKRGQNIKLASKLTGWRLDVRSVTVAEEEARRARLAIEAISGIDFHIAELLFQSGFRSARDIADSTIEELTEIDGVSSEKASEIIANAKTQADIVAAQVVEGEKEDENLPSDLDQLLLGPDLREKLFAAGKRTIQSVAEQKDEELLAIPEVTDSDVNVIKDALDAFFVRGLSARKDRERR